MDEFDQGELIVSRLDGRGLDELQQRRLMAAFICDRGLAEQFVMWLDDNTKRCPPEAPPRRSWR
jgi:hypothetical protein